MISNKPQETKLSNTQILDFITRDTSNKKSTYSIIWLHGLGADYHDFCPIVNQLGIPEHINVRFIFPNAPVRKVTVNGNFPCRAWYDIYSLTDRQKEDSNGIQNSQLAINELIKQEIHNGTPSSHIFLAGFSQGGAMALYTGLRYEQPLAGILALSCYLPLKDSTDQLHPANKNTPILQHHGDNDDVVPKTLGESTCQILKQHSYDAHLKTYPTGHEVCFQQIKDIGIWITEALQSKT
jgi:phospholipase/carboxylesterase